MSETRYKTVLRACVPELDTYSYDKAFVLIERIFGKPNDIEICDDLVEYFAYRQANGVFVPLKCSDTNLWFLDYIFNLSCEYVDDSIINVKKIVEIEKKMRTMFPAIKDIFVVNYMWYTGSEEPVGLDLETSNEFTD